MTTNLDPAIRRPMDAAHYVPLCDFRQKMKEASVVPYECTFSFNPLLVKARKRNLTNDSDNFNRIKDVIKSMEEQLENFTIEGIQEGGGTELDALMTLFFPSLFQKGTLGFVGKPFTKEFAYMTDAAKMMMFSDRWEVQLMDTPGARSAFSPIINVATLLLKKFYLPQLSTINSEKFVIRDTETDLERHFKIEVILDYVDVVAKRPIPELTDAEIHHLTNNLDNTELWLKHFPPEDFSFSGFMIGTFQEITDSELVHQLQQWMVSDKADVQPREALSDFQCIVRSFLKDPDITVGAVLLSNIEMMSFFSWSVLGDASEIMKIPRGDFHQGIYGRIRKELQPIIIGDLREEDCSAPLDRRIRDLGMRSLLFIPLLDGDGKLLSTFELFHPEPYRFSRLTIQKLADVNETFTLGTQRYIQQLNDEINLFVQQEFTSIHPSVQWKFTEISKKYLWSTNPDEREGLEPILFDHVYPLYAQADIVGSSNLRNESIIADFIDNLERLVVVMQEARDVVHFHLLDIYLAKSKEILGRLREGHFASSDESQVMNMLITEIHPLLRELAINFPQIPTDSINQYFDQLDSQLGVIYHHRKDYEDSVGQLNEILARFLEREDNKMQEVLPHFFEKYSTDGIEYNIYLGQSLLPKGRFSNFYLKDFRVWQLLSMCELTRLVAEKGRELPVPLTTAQLVFVYNNPLSISFKMEEKQFDVDGTYNVRYEILKKRIDKAVIKQTGERLTQAGKIAIVWLQEQDRLEYLEYLEHLIKQGHLEPGIEELELDKLQGAEGLRALRVTVAV
ncbi:MAG: GAF domain-containing protein [Bacteroidota bacterium]